jgi:hypothetical protein
MSKIDLSKTSDVLAKLVTEQLVIRLVLCGRSHFPGCRIELLSGLKKLECQKDMGAFVHTTSDFYWDNEKRRFVESFVFNPTFCPAEANMEPAFHDGVTRAVDYWQRNVTPDSETSQVEWLEPKPFVGVLTSGRGSSSPTQRLNLQQDARPFLGYYGLLHSQLAAYVHFTSTTRSYNKELERQAEAAAHVQRRFQELFMQAMLKQFSRAFDAV